MNWTEIASKVPTELGDVTKERLNKYITKEKQNQNLKRLKELKTQVIIKPI